MTYEAVAQRPARTRPVAIPIIDADMHNYAPPATELIEYLEPKWRDHLTTYGFRTFQPLKFGGAPYPRSAGGGKRQDAKPPSGKPVGTDVGFFIEQHLDGLPIEYGVLNCASAVGVQLHTEFDAAVARAINNWMVPTWLESDSRFLASIIVGYDDPALAAEEIERWGSDPRFVQVYLRQGTREPIGRRRYWPIFEAAERHGLTIGMHFGAISGNPLTSAGWPSYYIEEHAVTPAVFQSHIISLICEGVFERFPKLKFVCIESGFAWLPSLMWRLDKQWRRLGAEMPHVERLPSETIREHIRLTTQPMEEPDKFAHLLQTIEHFGSDDMLIYSSDYPHWDYDAPDRAIRATMPDELRRKIFSENARQLWNLPESRSR